MPLFPPNHYNIGEGEKKIPYFRYNSSRNFKKIVIKVVKGGNFKYNNNEGE